MLGHLFFNIGQGSELGPVAESQQGRVNMECMFREGPGDDHETYFCDGFQGICVHEEVDYEESQKP